MFEVLALLILGPPIALAILTLMVIVAPMVWVACGVALAVNWITHSKVGKSDD